MLSSSSVSLTLLSPASSHCPASPSLPAAQPTNFHAPPSHHSQLEHTAVSTVDYLVVYTLIMDIRVKLLEDQGDQLKVQNKGRSVLCAVCVPPMCSAACVASLQDLYRSHVYPAQLRACV